MYDLQDFHLFKYLTIKERLQQVKKESIPEKEKLWDYLGVSFLAESRLFGHYTLSKPLLLSIIYTLFLVYYTMSSPYDSNVALFIYSLLQSAYILSLKKQEPLVIFWFIYAIDTLIEIYYARDNTDFICERDVVIKQSYR
ncbi:hypothetical protein pb186bvf_019544 [Paramecium bursaria]